MARTKKLSTKIAAVALAAAVVVGGGTFAYLQASTDAVENQFNPNQVTVTLDENSTNSFEVIPGQSDTKDPQVHVTATVDAWVFVTVEDETGDAVSWAYDNGWTIMEGEQDDSFILYRAVTKNDNVQDFDIISGNTVSYPASLTNEDLAAWNDAPKSLTFQAYAIQRAGFDTAEAAWAQLTSSTPVSGEATVAAGEDTNITAKMGSNTYTANVPADSVLTLVAAEGETAQQVTLAENDALKLVVTPDEADPDVTATTAQSKVTYDVALYVSDDGGEFVAVASSSKPIKVSVDLDVVDLVSFYHKDTQYTNKVDSAEKVLAVGDFYPVVDTTKAKTTVTFLTESFSPFTSVVKFGGGLGTEEFPYIIETLGHMKGIGTECAWSDDADAYVGSYSYYVVSDDVKVIDAEGGSIATNICGFFDGNGVAFKNVNSNLFSRVFGNKDFVKGEGSAVLKNFSVEFKNSDGGVVYWNTAKNLTLENVTVTGTLEGGYNFASFIDYAGVNNNSEHHITMKNCSSNATIIYTNGGAAGYVGHPYSNAASTFDLVNTTYTGELYAPGGSTCAFSSCWLNGTLTVDGAVVSNPNGKYDAAHSHSISYTAGTLPEKYGTFTVDKLEGYDHAVAILTIGPNGNGTTYTGGYYCNDYIVETSKGGDLVVGDTTITTKDIKFYDITCNGTATTSTGLSNDGHTFNIVQSAYNNEIGGANVRIIQYNADGVIIGITSWNVTPAE